MTNSAQYWIDTLGLIAHPEGGYFRETYRASLSIAREALPPEFTGPRRVLTAIYFLLEGHNFSAFHRLRSDELWHFYVGGPFVVHVIRENGQHSEISIGSNPDAGEVLQADKTGIVIGCGRDALRILALQLEGGRRLTAQSFLTGHPLKPGQKLG